MFVPRRSEIPHRREWNLLGVMGIGNVLDNSKSPWRVIQRLSQSEGECKRGQGYETKRTVKT